jgi:hypothetical protein
LLGTFAQASGPSATPLRSVVKGARRSARLLDDDHQIVIVT